MAPSNPSPWDLIDHPELASLALLEHALEMAARALLAAHPDLATPSAEQASLPCEPESILADHIVATNEALARLVSSYRLVLTVRDRPSPSPAPYTGNDDIPF